MDFHRYHDFGVNGSLERSRNSQHRKPFEDEGLQFLSREEKECILFFEETIGSLDDESEDPNLGLSSGSRTSVDRRSASPSPITGINRPTSPKVQDIIDLVRNQHVPTEHRDAPFSPPMPDFRTMTVNPETHFEMKAKREPMENFPPEYPLSPPSLTPSAPNDDSFSQSLYQPAGSIPTPVLIAQKLSENNGGGANIPSSSVLSSRRRSNESLSPPPDSPVRQGPPTLAKPTRYPDNISFMLGNREYNQTIAKAAVNVNERRAKVLANLTGGPLALNPEENSERNIPNRSFSFQDPTPDRSRMEALSKLGLVHKHSFPGNRPITTSTPQPTTKPEMAFSNFDDNDSKPRTTTPPLASPTTSSISPSDFNSYGGKSKVVNPSSILSNKMDANSHSVVTSETKPLVSQRSLDSGAPVDYNSYGGKSITMHPSVASVPKRDYASQHVSSYESGPSAVGPPQRATEAWTEASPCDLNSRGGKTKVITPAHPPTAKAESSPESFVPHDSRARPPPASNRAEAFPSDSSLAINLNSYGGKSTVVTPSHLPGTKPEVTTSVPRPAAPPPSVTPRPHSYRVEPRPPEAPRPSRQEDGPGAHGGSLPPEARRRAVSKPSLFPQGVTVQFSGRGTTDESRRQALRKLGLLKNKP